MITRRLSSSQLNILTAAAVRPLRRVNGGWIAPGGDFVRKNSADSLLLRGLLISVHSGPHGPGLVLSREGRAAIGHKEKMPA